MLPLNASRLYLITSRSVRPVLALLLTINLIAAASAEDEPAKKKGKKGDAAAAKVAIRPSSEIDAKTKKPLTYQEAYDSIPFSRAEYDANPAYRHDAAMELVFGMQRPTTIVKLPAGHQPPRALQVNQNVSLGLHPSLYALRLGKTY
ncbi:MAG: hypothetical protein HZA46_08945 [Planctomycetales bacterium]|nr:hypothetical protein [Planctomycetales bacterium]